MPDNTSCDTICELERKNLIIELVPKLDNDVNTAEVCLQIQLGDGQIAETCVDFKPFILQCLQLLPQCPIDAMGSIPYASGPGVTPDNSAGFVLSNINGQQPTRYCVTDGPSGRQEYWITLLDTQGNWQWHQLDG